MGPPELPGFTLASVTISAPCSRACPDETIPRVTLMLAPRRSMSGKPMTVQSAPSPGLSVLARARKGFSGGL